LNDAGRVTFRGLERAGLVAVVSVYSTLVTLGILYLGRQKFICASWVLAGGGVYS
jgi:hypothetical protein